MAVSCAFRSGILDVEECGALTAKLFDAVAATGGITREMGLMNASSCGIARHGSYSNALGASLLLITKSSQKVLASLMSNPIFTDRDWCEMPIGTTTLCENPLPSLLRCSGYATTGNPLSDEHHDIHDNNAAQLVARFGAADVERSCPDGMYGSAISLAIDRCFPKTFLALWAHPSVVEICTKRFSSILLPKLGELNQSKSMSLIVETITKARDKATEYHQLLALTLQLALSGIFVTPILAITCAYLL
jgi:hypothetical protein